MYPKLLNSLLIVASRPRFLLDQVKMFCAVRVHAKAMNVVKMTLDFFIIFVFDYGSKFMCSQYFCYV